VRLNDLSQDVRGQVALGNVAGCVCPQERVQQADQVFALLLLVAALDVDQELYAAALLLKHTVDQEKGVGHQLSISADLLDDLKEQPQVLLSFVFLTQSITGCTLHQQWLASVARRSCS
jgi:hypothetical protein